MRNAIAMALLFCASLVYGQTAALPVYTCIQNGVQATTSGQKSSNYMQGVVPYCTVVVYNTGTTVIATTTPQTPLTANVNGSIPPIYAPIGVGYDVVLSGGYAPNNYVTPLTLTDVIVGGGGGGGGTVTTTGAPSNLNLTCFSGPTSITLCSGVNLSISEVFSITTTYSGIGAGIALNAGGSSPLDLFSSSGGTSITSSGGITIGETSGLGIIIAEDGNNGSIQLQALNTGGLINIDGVSISLSSSNSASAQLNNSQICTMSTGCGGGGGSGTVESGSNYALPGYGSSASTVVGPLNITSDSTKNNLDIPGKLVIGSSTSPTLFQVTGQLIANLPSASSYPPIVTGSVTSYWQTEVIDATGYANCTSGTGNPATGIVMWCWSNGTIWEPGLPPPSGLSDPGANGIVKRTALGVSAVAVSTDVAAIFPALSGDCATSTNSTVTICAHGFTTLTDASPITWAGGGNISNAVVMLNHSTSTRAINISGLVSGDYGTLIIKQDSTGGANITGGTGCTWYVGQSSGGYTATSTFFASAPAANAIDIIAFTVDGSGNCYANAR